MTTVYDDARESAALDISRNRKLAAIWLPSGRCRPQTAQGTYVGSVDYSDPVEAFEGAEAIITAGETRDLEQNIRRLSSSLMRGVYVPWPRAKQDGNLEWLVLRVSDRSAVGSSWPGWLACAIEIARILSEPTIQPVGGDSSLAASR